MISTNDKIQSSRTLMICAAATAVVMLAGSGCASKKPKETEFSPNAAIESTDLGNSDMGNAMGLESVRFEYDSAILSSRSKDLLKKDADILKNNPNIAVQVEGHCDARGGIQYNLALGQRRADSVAHFLADQGVAQSRLTTISYGKERPLVSGDTDEAYAKNRRANLAITKK